MSKTEDNSKVKPTSFRISNEAKALLKLIAKKEKRSAGKSLETMIEEKAAALGITAAKIQ